jgi:hypothetical protein
MNLRPDTRHFAVAALASLAICAVLAPQAMAEIEVKPRAGVTSVSAACAGDVISGKLRVTGPMKVKLTLLARASAKAAFRPTGKSRTLKTPKAGAYSYKFDISRLDAYGYRIDATKSVRSTVILAAGCAPGHQVPEAPFALLLPLTLLLTVGIPVLMLRRRARFVPS